MEDFSGAFESSATKKSSGPALREEPSRRRVAVVASKSTCQPRAAPRHLRVRDPSFAKKEPRRMGGKCQNFPSASAFPINPLIRRVAAPPPGPSQLRPGKERKVRPCQRDLRQ